MCKLNILECKAHRSDSHILVDAQPYQDPKAAWDAMKEEIPQDPSVYAIAEDIIGTGGTMVSRALEATETLEKEDISAEVIDPLPLG